MKTNNLRSLNNFFDLIDEFYDGFGYPKQIPRDSKNLFISKYIKTNVKDSYVKANIIELDNSFVIDLLVPKIKKEKVQINVDNGYLLVTYDDTNVEASDIKSIIEREYNEVKNFKKIIKLQEDVNLDKITAKYNDGILSIEIEKKEKLPIKIVEVL